MNIEEFKVSLLEQFKENNAPVWTLMFRREANQNQPCTHQYLDHAYYVANEFNIGIDICKVTDSNDGDRFQIRFVDMSGYPEVEWGSYSDVDLSILSQGIGLYCEEILTYKHGSIIFSLKIYKMYADDNYKFSHKISLVGYSIIFYFETLNLNSDLGIDKALKEWNNFRENGIVDYLDLPIIKRMFVELKTVLNSSNLLPTVKNKILDIFSNTAEDGELSTMTQIIEQLKDVNE